VVGDHQPIRGGYTSGDHTGGNGTPHGSGADNGDPL
jgi:hypothetical protein